MGGGAGAHGSRLGRRGDDIAGQADFAFAEEEHGFVLAGLGFARRQQWAGCLCMSGLLGRVSGRFRRAFAKLGQMSGKLRRVSEPPGREFEEPVRAAKEPGVASERFRRATTGSRFTAKEFSAAWRGGAGRTLMVARFIIGLRQGS